MPTYGRRLRMKDKLRSLESVGITEEETHVDDIVHISPVVVFGRTKVISV